MAPEVLEKVTVYQGIGECARLCCYACDSFAPCLAAHTVGRFDLFYAGREPSPEMSAIFSSALFV